MTSDRVRGECPHLPLHSALLIVYASSNSTPRLGSSLIIHDIHITTASSRVDSARTNKPTQERNMNVRPPGPTLRCKTPRFSHHSLAFSPFFENHLAVASGANFGLVGNGRLHILEVSEGGLGVAKW
jgi:hypothetical protein